MNSTRYRIINKVTSESAYIRDSNINFTRWERYIYLFTFINIKTSLITSTGRVASSSISNIRLYVWATMVCHLNLLKTRLYFCLIDFRLPSIQLYKVSICTIYVGSKFLFVTALEPNIFGDYFPKNPKNSLTTP